MTMRRISVGLLALALSLVFVGPALAASKEDAAKKVRAAIRVLEYIDKEIEPSDREVQMKLLKKARAVAIFPGMIKAGFILGGSGGTGLIMARNKDGWGPPAFYQIGGASVGLQIGISSSDLLLVIMTDNGLKGILKGHAKLGVGASIAAGPVGRDARAATSDPGKGADIYSFSRTKGAFAGVSLEGAGMEFEADTTKNYYGKALTLEQVISGKGVPMQPDAKRLIQTLTHYTK